jgi:hypothetical protein
MIFSMVGKVKMNGLVEVPMDPDRRAFGRMYTGFAHGLAG